MVTLEESEEESIKYSYEERSAADTVKATAKAVTFDLPGEAPEVVPSVHEIEDRINRESEVEESSSSVYLTKTTSSRKSETSKSSETSSESSETSVVDSSSQRTTSRVDTSSQNTSKMTYTESDFDSKTGEVDI